MINTDRVKIALAATPLCQREWVRGGDDGEPSKLCAVSALAAFAGVQPSLLKRLHYHYCNTGNQLVIVANAVLQVEYGITPSQTSAIVHLFDNALCVEDGITQVINYCEKANDAETLRADALRSSGAMVLQPVNEVPSTLMGMYLAAKKAKMAAMTTAAADAEVEAWFAKAGPVPTPLQGAYDDPPMTVQLLPSPLLLGKAMTLPPLTPYAESIT